MEALRDRMAHAILILERQCCKSSLEANPSFKNPQSDSMAKTLRQASGKKSTEISK